jgi:hypothetical protein
MRLVITPVLLRTEQQRNLCSAEHKNFEEIYAITPCLLQKKQCTQVEGEWFWGEPGIQEVKKAKAISLSVSRTTLFVA